MNAELIKKTFDAQVANQFAVGNSNAKERIEKLKKLHAAVLKFRPELKIALKKDFGKHPSEVDLTETFHVTSEIKHAIRNLRSWMKVRRVPTPLALLGASSHVQYEPKGVTLLISPWNFPFNLTMGPMVGAIAAGNTIIIKPSENTPHTSSLMNKMVTELFSSNEVALFEGGVDVSSELLALPFNHIFFTGSPGVGKVIMEGASKHLTSVTLELGGKSPTIVDKTANLKTAAKRIAWSKFINAGQICIAPDYVLVDEEKKEEFIELLGKQIKRYYGENSSDSSDLARIVNGNHFNRVKSYIDESLAMGAKVVLGGQSIDATNTIAPTLVDNVDLASPLMTNEIFGPVLPIVSYSNIEDAAEIINQGEKPLALYIFSKSRKNIRFISKNTRAGGTCVNQAAVHYYNYHLPFGGSNNSGIGKTHGFSSFKEFSNNRSVFEQHIPNALELLTPPYNNFKQRLIDMVIKWF